MIQPGFEAKIISMAQCLASSSWPWRVFSSATAPAAKLPKWRRTSTPCGRAACTAWQTGSCLNPINWWVSGIRLANIIIQKQRCQKKTWNKPTQWQQHLFHLLLIVGVLCLNKFTVASESSNAPIAPRIPTVPWAHRAWYSSTEPGANNLGSTWQLH